MFVQCFGYFTSLTQEGYRIAIKKLTYKRNFGKVSSRRNKGLGLKKIIMKLVINI